MCAYKIPSCSKLDSQPDGGYQRTTLLRQTLHAVSLFGNRRFGIFNDARTHQHIRLFQYTLRHILYVQIDPQPPVAEVIILAIPNRSLLVPKPQGSQPLLEPHSFCSLHFIYTIYCYVLFILANKT